jgi:hypothetical protein
MSISQIHGFVWPDKLPKCVLCDRAANDTVHITPSRHRPIQMPMRIAADKTASPQLPMRSHAYMMNVPTLVSQIQCLACGQTIDNGVHAVGLPSGVMPSSSNSDMYGGGYGGGWTPATLASDDGDPLATQQAFVAEVGPRLIFAAPASTSFKTSALPSEVASAFQTASNANPHNLWLAGRYVEANHPNRNAAYWSTADLELGQASVAHGPINWLHKEKHVIGAIAASAMVVSHPQAAADGTDVPEPADPLDVSAPDDGIGNHIVILGALWPYIYPQETRIIAQASDAQRLWFSMECVSKEVACLTCDRELSYADYMDQSKRCEHMKEGMPRRFVDPVFGGAGIIVPPVRPGWANADAHVLMPQAAALVERQAASFTGMTTAESELMVAEILASLDLDA